MKKSEISEVLLTLWQNCDQAACDTIINEAFSNCPVSVQKKLIEQLIDYSDEWHDEELKQETLEKARKILKLNETE